MGDRLRVLAVDWSGRVAGERRAIWLAEAVCPNGHAGLGNGPAPVTRLQCGRNRQEVADHVIELARADPELAVGFDFSFSLPWWFLAERNLESADALWAAAARDGDTWLARCEPPFWGRPGRPRPELPDHFRATEADLPAMHGVRAKSTFQVGGAGSVGSGSIRGFPMLERLRAAGFRIWPFHDEPRVPVVVEIYPRLFTGAVVKSRADARAAYLAEHMPELREEFRFDATASEDAFDALVSVHRMTSHAGVLASLSTLDDARTRLEGRVWHPT